MPDILFNANHYPNNDAYPGNAHIAVSRPTASFPTIVFNVKGRGSKLYTNLDSVGARAIAEELLIAADEFDRSQPVEITVKVAAEYVEAVRNYMKSIGGEVS